MSFDDEWAAIVENVRARNSSQTQLNSADTPIVPPGGGGAGAVGGKGGLKHGNDVTNRAARHIEEVLGPATRRAGGKAEEGSAGIVGNYFSSPLSISSDSDPLMLSPGSMAGWDVQDGLRKRHEEWQRSLKQLEQRLVREQHALRNAYSTFTRTDQDIGSSFRKYMNEERSSPQLPSNYGVGSKDE